MKRLILFIFIVCFLYPVTADTENLSWNDPEGDVSYSQNDNPINDTKLSIFNSLDIIEAGYNYDTEEQNGYFYMTLKSSPVFEINDEIETLMIEIGIEQTWNQKFGIFDGDQMGVKFTYDIKNNVVDHLKWNPNENISNSNGSKVIGSNTIRFSFNSTKEYDELFTLARDDATYEFYAGTHLQFNNDSIIVDLIQIDDINNSTGFSFTLPFHVIPILAGLGMLSIIKKSNNNSI